MDYPILIWGVLFFVFGIYQLCSGRPTMLSKKLLRVFNLNEHFLKLHGILGVILGMILLVCVFYYKRLDGSIYSLYICFILVGIVYCSELFMVCIMQRNIDGLPLSEIWKSICILLFICIFVWYFRPASLADLIENSKEVRVTMQEMDVCNNGNTYIDTEDCILLSAERKKQLCFISDQYWYFANASTFKEDGEIKKHPDKIMILYIDGDGGLKTVVLTSMQEIFINNRSYTMPKSWEYMNELEEILNNLGKNG